MYGRNITNMLNNSNVGTAIKNFDLIFCDFIKHPIASIINDNISKITSMINIILKLTKKMEDTIFSILVI